MMANIKDKIEKLLRQTIENGATESEAQNALLLARKLMLKYKIDKKDIIKNENDIFDETLYFLFQFIKRSIKFIIITKI